MGFVRSEASRANDIWAVARGGSAGSHQLPREVALGAKMRV